MSSGVNNGNQPYGFQDWDKMDPPLYESIGPSDYPMYPSNMPPVNPGWNLYNAASQSVTTANLQQWNMQSAAAVPSMPQPWNRHFGLVMPQNTDQTLFRKAVLNGKLKVKGSLLVGFTFLQIALGFGLSFTIANFTWKSYIPFWGSLFHIVTGALAIRTQEKVKIHLVKYSLAFSILTSLISFTEIILISMDYTHTNCNLIGSYFEFERCLNIRVVALAILSVLLVINLVLFCVSIAIVTVSCRALHHQNTNASQEFTLHNGAQHPTPLETIPSAPPADFLSDLPTPYLERYNL